MAQHLLPGSLSIGEEAEFERLLPGGVYVVQSGVVETRHTLTATDSKSSNTSSDGAVLQSHKVALQNALQNNVSSLGVVVQRHLLQVSDLHQDNLSSSGNTVQRHALVVESVLQLNKSTDGAINQNRHALITQSVHQSNGVSSGPVAQRHVLSSVATDQMNKSSGGIIVQQHQLSAEWCDQQNLASAGAVNVRHMLVLGHCVQVNTSNQEAGWVFVPSVARTIHITPSGFEGGDFWDFTDPRKPTAIKDPLNGFDISFDWTQYLEEIQAGLSSHQLILSPELANDLDVRDGALCTLFISEGVGLSFVTCRVQIDSDPPRSEDRTVWFNIADI